jgi:hypothetical protein
LSLTKYVIDAFQPRGAAFNMRFVVQTKIATDIDSSLIVTIKNDFDIGMQQRPALQSVALNNADVPAKRLEWRIW